MQPGGGKLMTVRDRRLAAFACGRRLGLMSPHRAARAMIGGDLAGWILDDEDEVRRAMPARQWSKWWWQGYFSTREHK